MAQEPQVGNDMPPVAMLLEAKDAYSNQLDKGADSLRAHSTNLRDTVQDLSGFVEKKHKRVRKYPTIPTPETRKQLQLWSPKRDTAIR